MQKANVKHVHNLFRAGVNVKRTDETVNVSLGTVYTQCRERFRWRQRHSEEVSHWRSETTKKKICDS